MTTPPLLPAIVTSSNVMTTRRGVTGGSTHRLAKAKASWRPFVTVWIIPVKVIAAVRVTRETHGGFSGSSVLTTEDWDQFPVPLIRRLSSVDFPTEPSA